MRLSRQVALASSFLAISLSLSCSGGDEAPRPATSPLPTVTATGSVVTPAGIGGARVIDLASTPVMTVVYAAEPGDLQSDQPGLAIGDFNDDGIDDIATGARFGDAAGREDAGAVYLIFGSPDPPTSVDLAGDEQDVTIVGARPADNLGFAAAAADLNGDGIDDLILGAAFAGPLDQPRSQPGRVYLILGRRDPPARIDLARDSADVTITGAADQSFFGDSVASGDINGDGAADLIVGATFDTGPGANDQPVRGGAAHVFFGRRQWPASLGAADSNVSVFGAEDFDELGDFVASGDINGDGFDEIIATAEAADGPENARPVAGEVHVVFGGEETAGDIKVADNPLGLSIYGAREQDTLGFSLATGDIDGDGIDDLVAGAHLASNPAGGGVRRSGAVFVLFGADRLPTSIDLAEAPAGVATIFGQNESDLLGGSEAVADLNGDNQSELIMATGFAAAASRSEAGAVYVVDKVEASGDLGSLAEALTTVIYGAEASDRLGSNLATADFNGDGRLELIVVADGADGPNGSRSGAGRVYVINQRR